MGELHCHLKPQAPIGVFAFRVLRHMQSAQSVHHSAIPPMLAVTIEGSLSVMGLFFHTIPVLIHPDPAPAELTIRSPESGEMHTERLWLPCAT